jgi:hypothetical protein
MIYLAATCRFIALTSVHVSRRIASDNLVFAFAGCGTLGELELASTCRLACVPWFHGKDNLLVRQPSEMSDEHNLGLTDWWCVRRWSATSLDSEL